MKFFTYAAAALPLATAALIQERAVGLPKVEATINLSEADLDQSLPSINALTLLSELLEKGEIDILGKETTGDSTALSKRSDVPGLHCGYARATRCALSTSGALATCIWAAISVGKDIKEDTKCAAAIVALGANPPNDCKLCLGL